MKIVKLVNCLGGSLFCLYALPTRILAHAHAKAFILCDSTIISLSCLPKVLNLTLTYPGCFWKCLTNPNSKTSYDIGVKTERGLCLLISRTISVVIYKN